MTPVLLDEIDSYRVYFDTMYVGGIPHLLNEDGAYLAFLAIVSATDALSGLFAPNKPTGERFRLFVERYFPEDHRPYAERLWNLRNAVVHSFNPGPDFVLTFHTSRQHLKSPLSLITLNAEDLFAALLFAARSYFDSLLNDSQLQENFQKRIAATDGGAPEAFVMQQYPRVQR
ncbi:hypothetical protein ABHF54_13065 [Nitrosomonas europaea]|uniref:hypothetical protein n=1 Tax=Nitrosomonas europaea TaxID=915 RepID=UPI0032674293